MVSVFMALKSKYQRKEEIPAEHLPFYAEREGAWQLDVEGPADKVLGRAA